MLDKRNSEEIDIPAEPVTRFNAGPPARPPFLSPAREGGAAHRWWGGLTKQSKLSVLLAVGALIVVISISWIASSATGDVSNKAVLVDVTETVPPMDTSAHFTENVYFLGLSTLTFRLDETASNASLTTLELMAEMPHLTRSTGSKDVHSRAMPVIPTPLAGAGRASGLGESRETSGEDTVNGDAELLRRGNQIADRYVPLYQAYLDEVTVIQDTVEPLWPPEEFKASYDLLLKSCDTLSRAMSESIRGLELLRNASYENALQADRAIQESSRLLFEGTGYLNQSAALLPLP